MQTTIISYTAKSISAHFAGTLPIIWEETTLTSASQYQETQA
jgi:hypothetical protein